MQNVHITDLQAVDFALGGVIAGCYNALAKDDGPQAFQRFLSRPDAERIYLVKNDNVQTALRKLARLEDESHRKGPDLPVIMYYREQGISADANQFIQVAEETHFVQEEPVMGMDTAMQVTTIPLTLTYSMLFLAWDRATIERMALAWWAYIAPLRRKHSRFLVPDTLNGERFEVGASINAPREILTSSENMDEEGKVRLWGSRTMIEVNTQAVYGAKVERKDYITVITEWEVVY